MADARTQKYDLTTGGVFGRMMLVALPIMGTNLVEMAYNLVDVFYLGRVSSDAVAAAGAAGMFMWLASGMIYIGRMGAEIGVSQSIGRRDREEAARYASNAATIAVLLGLVIGLMLIVLRKPFVGFYGFHETNVVSDAERYLAIVAVGIPFTYLSTALVGTFNGSGNARTPFLIDSFGLALNMVLDPILIFGANLGVIGAALATTIAQIVGAMLMLLAMKRLPNRPFASIRLFRRPSGAHVRVMLRWSIPVALESLLFTVMSMLTQRMIAGYGAGAVATTRVGAQIESLSWLIGGGYGSAVTSFIGQNFGARKPDRIRRCIRISTIAMTVWGLFTALMLWFAGGQLFLLFLPDQSLLHYAVSYLRIMAVSQIPICIEGVFGGAFRGEGDTGKPAVASVISNVLRVLIAFALEKTVLGIDGVFWGITLSTIIRGFWIAIWYMIKHRSKRIAQTHGEI